ncbi:MAG: glycosyltransferase family 4 protein [Nanoarchaeota archaeon]|nr:glycosyltransferase family 4 protein [Nanoarchaeota archaeon]MBU1028038.1 glycosyltransferase family 4 protein [Nanoarchaeota archaeon]
MKIIQLTAFFLPVEGGMEQHVLNLCRELQKNNHSVEVICSDSMREGTIFIKKEKIQGIKITRYKTFWNITKLSKIFPGFIFDLFKKDYDLLHVHSYRQPYTLMGLIVAKLMKKKCIITTHCPLHQKGTRSRGTYFLAVLYDRIFGKIASKFNHIIGIANEEISFFSRYGINNKKITIIPNGITKKEFKIGNRQEFRKKYKIKKNDFVALFTGRIHKTKGLQNLKYAVDNLPKIKFVFAGLNDGYMNYLKKMYCKNKNVIFTGKIDHLKMPNAYAAADIFILPSDYEPFGISLLEAMAQRLPIISTNQGGPVDFITKDFGFLINPKNQKEWFNLINYLLKNPKKRKKMGKYAKKEAENYLWTNIGKKIIKVYETC